MTIDDYREIEESYSFVDLDLLQQVNTPEDNPEWCEEDERTEWSGRLQQPLDEEVVPIEDKPVRPLLVDNGDTASEKLDKLIERVRNNTESIGIDVNAVVEKLMDQPIVKNTLQPYVELIDKYEKLGDKEALEAAKEDYEKQLTAYKERYAQQVEDAIDEMSVALKEIKLGVNNLSSAATTVVSIGLPSATGVPPNPIKIAADVLAYKNALSSAVGQLNSAIMRFLKTAKKNKIPISDTLISMIDSALGVVTTILNII